MGSGSPEDEIVKNRIFVPCTDEIMDHPPAPAERLVPYHPDRPCWRMSPPKGEARGLECALSLKRGTGGGANTFQVKHAGNDG